MGSSGSGNFSDYPGGTNPAPRQGGASGQDECGKAYSFMLEEIDRCDWFSNHGDVPPIGTKLRIVHNLRLEAVSIPSNEVIGYIPTSYNFLAACLADGINYNGEVIAASTLPVLSVTIDIAP